MHTPKLGQNVKAPEGWYRTFELFAPVYHLQDPHEVLLVYARMINIFCVESSPWASLSQPLELQDVEDAILGIPADPDARELAIAASVAEYIAAGAADPAALLLDESPAAAAKHAVVFAVFFDRLSDDDSPLEDWFTALAYSARQTTGLEHMVMNIEVRKI